MLSERTWSSPHSWIQTTLLYLLSIHTAEVPTISFVANFQTFVRAWGACFPKLTAEAPVKSLFYTQDSLTDARVATLCLSTLRRRSHSASSAMYSLFTYLFLRQDLIMTCPRLASTPWSCFHLPSPRITDVSTTLTYCSLILLFCFGMMDALGLTKHFLWFM